MIRAIVDRLTGHVTIFDEWPPHSILCQCSDCLKNEEEFIKQLTESVKK